MKNYFTTIPCCYFPTSIVAIDDNHNFLDSLSLSLANDFAVQCYGEPLKILHVLNNEYKSDSFTKRCLLQFEEERTEHRYSDLDVRAIHREIYRPQRFNEISLVIVDYAMPDLNGVEFCEQLHDRNIKRIMLTGEAEIEIGMRAFNNGIIDQFILKSAPNRMSELKQTIKDLQETYFQATSESVVNRLINDNICPAIFLNDPSFIHFFNSLRDKNHIAEYYLMSEQGSFLMLDKQGQPSWLAMANEDMMETYYRLADDDNAPKEVVEALKNKQMIPYFHTEDDFHTRPSEWQPYLYPAKVLKGKETYYYACINDPSAYDISRDKILSYQAYLDSL